MEGDLGAYIKFVSPSRVPLLNELQYTNSSPRYSRSSQLADDSDFCQSSNIEQCIDYIDKELQMLGYKSIFNFGADFHLPSLLNATQSLLKKYQRFNRYKEDLESRAARANADLDQARSSAKRLKVNNECLHNELSKAEEVKRQLRQENVNLSCKCKSLSDELRRLKSQLHSNENQYRHELKKKDRQQQQLRDRAQQLLIDKSNKSTSHIAAASLEISSCLTRPDGKRRTWRNEASNLKNEDHLTKAVMTNYEKRCTALQAENRSLREMLSDMFEELYSLIPRSPSKSPRKDDLQLPVDMVQERIYQSIRDCCAIIKQTTSTSPSVMDTTFTVEVDEQTKASTPNPSPLSTSRKDDSKSLKHSPVRQAGSANSSFTEGITGERSPGRYRISEHKEQVKLAVEERDNTRGAL